MTEFTMWGGFFLVGTAAGLVFQRSRFCFVSAFRDLYLFRLPGMTRSALLLLFTLSLAGPPVVAWRAGQGLPVPALTGPWYWVLILSGLVFGVGMVMAGSCVAASFWRLGEGQLSQIWILVGLLAGARLVRWAELVPPGPYSQAADSTFVLFFLAAALGLLALRDRLAKPAGEEVLSTRTRVTARLPWTTDSGALAIAVLLLGTLAWSGRVWRVSSAIYSGDLLSGAFVVGLLTGGFVGARYGKEWRVRSAGSVPQGGLRTVGGFLMGLASPIGGGCTVGVLMGGAVSGSLNAWLWLVGAAVGAWLGSGLLRGFLNLTL